MRQAYKLMAANLNHSHTRANSIMCHWLRSEGIAIGRQIKRLSDGKVFVVDRVDYNDGARLYGRPLRKNSSVPSTRSLHIGLPPEVIKNQ